MDGFINLNKPLGYTSHDCIAAIRRLLRQKKVGHAGTLDPAATGVLPIAIGRATRLLQFLRDDKAYRATIRFGLRTATDDLDGAVLEQCGASHLQQYDVLGWLPSFQGVIQQVPPSYSAIQVGGKRLYELARAGKSVEVPVRTVEVFCLQPFNWRGGDYPELDVAIACGSGTYIRAIARDLGDYVGTGATLAALERTESSGFSLATSITLDQLRDCIQAGEFAPIPPDKLLKHLPILHLKEAIAHRWRMGQKIPARDLMADGVAEGVAIMQMLDVESPVTQIQVYDEGDRFLGIGEFTHQPSNSNNEPEHSGSAIFRPRMVFLPV